MTNLGYWMPIENPDNLLIYVLAFPSREARDASFKAFGADPEWKAAQQASEANGKLVTKVDQLFLNATDFSPEIKPSTGGKERVFELRTYTTGPGNLPALLNRFRDHTMKLFAKHGMTNLCYWQLAPASRGGQHARVSARARQRRRLAPHRSMPSALIRVDRRKESISRQGRRLAHHPAAGRREVNGLHETDRLLADMIGRRQRIEKACHPERAPVGEGGATRNRRISISFPFTRVEGVRASNAETERDTGYWRSFDCAPAIFRRRDAPLRMTACCFDARLAPHSCDLIAQPPPFERRRLLVDRAQRWMRWKRDRRDEVVAHTAVAVSRSVERPVRASVRAAVKIRRGLVDAEERGDVEAARSERCDGLRDVRAVEADFVHPPGESIRWNVPTLISTPETRRETGPAYSAGWARNSAPITCSLPSPGRWRATAAPVVDRERVHFGPPWQVAQLKPATTNPTGRKVRARSRSAVLQRHRRFAQPHLGEEPIR